MAKSKLFKRIILSALIVMFSFGVGIIFSACDGKHTHVCTNYTITKQASCTEEGYMTGVCDVCGADMSKSIDKLPHDFDDWTITSGATCNKEGSQTRTCQTCSYVEEEVIPTIEHSRFVEIERLEPTCTDAGHTQQVICSMCGEKLEESVPIEPTGHVFGDWIEIDAATCMQEGLFEKKCEVCEHIETKQVNKLDHAWGSFQPINDDGGTPKHKRECSNCHTTEEFECNFANQKIIDATCTTDGKTVEYCTQCEREAVLNVKDKLGHNYKVYPVQLDEDSGTEHTHQHYEKCERCGDEKEKVDCKLEEQETKPATCTTDECTIYKCNTCGVIHEKVNTENPATGHTWEYENISMNAINGQHLRRCSTCQTEETERCDRNVKVVKANCEHGGYCEYTCSKCDGMKQVPTAGEPKLDHILQYTFTGTDKDHATHKITCAREGCDYLQENVPCELDDTSSIKPTCDAAGQNHYICLDCEKEFTEEGGLATGHDWKMTNKDATNHYYTCNNCHQIKEEAHEFEEVEISAAKCEKNRVIKKVCLKEDCDYETEEFEQIGTALKHEWNISKITADEHTGECNLCHEHITAAHDFADSNLCASCKFDGLTYSIEGQHVIVSKSDAIVNAKTKNIIISTYKKLLDTPAEDGDFYEKEEYPVTIVKKNGFISCPSIETITLPASLTEIREGAFSGLMRLQSVEIVGDDPKLEKIEEMAFLNCTALNRFVGAKNLKSIGRYAFSNCTTLHEITVPDTLEDVAEHVFLNTGFANDSSHWVDDALYLGKHLIKVRQTLKDDGSYTNSEFTIKEDTLSIAANAFEGCKNLTKLTINAELKRIDRDAFKDCTAISQVDYLGDIYGWLSIAFANDYSSPLFYGNTGLHIEHAEGKVDLTDKDKVTRTITNIPAGTFRGTGITSITLPSSLKFIGSEAFEDCESLSEIKFENDTCNVTYIGEDVLKNTAYYKNTANWDKEKVLYLANKILIEAKTDLNGTYEVKSGTTSVAARAFENCTQLTMVTFNAELQYIGENVFAGCTSMDKVKFDGQNYNWYSNRLDYSVTHMYNFKSGTEQEQRYNYQIISQNKGACTKRLSDY